jgi:hypothetical protein
LTRRRAARHAWQRHGIAIAGTHDLPGDTTWGTSLHSAHHAAPDRAAETTVHRASLPCMGYSVVLIYAVISNLRRITPLKKSSVHSDRNKNKNQLLLHFTKIIKERKFRPKEIQAPFGSHK